MAEPAQRPQDGPSAQSSESPQSSENPLSSTSSQGSQSVGTVIVAGLANLAVAVAKALAGVLSGSAAVLSEAAHSVADTTTEVLLFVALRRGSRPATSQYPFGYGRESYIWAFMAAVVTFVIGAGFSIFQGVDAIQERREKLDATVAYLVLAVSFVAEGISLLRSVRQLRRRAARWRVPWLRVVRNTPNTTIKAVLLEDSAALVGLVLAGAGVTLSELTGSPVWDGIASIAIGVLLLMVATTLAHNNIRQLVGRAAGEAVREEIHQELSRVPDVRGVDRLMTMQLGPEDILVAVKINFAEEATREEIEIASDEAERRLVTRNPAIRYVFLDPTRRRP
ncbi:cation diffusion facilitator family transporter [Plantactinospora soyae]|uniref:Cation diffusion facilitator family transporter n=1 Tax=Plantactinospora soyae TaxID=1544732 RepID=A0A927M3Q0_9ACTN|nr:cation diffusion facilitator family transporter [Plantactinospora soyae]MBE1486342.1 cation diffusion facilitator family transporter [Plantactinospora soyae]